MKKWSFTLLEIIVVLVIIGILASIGIPSYQLVVENSKAKVCQQNLQALQASLDIYGMEHDTMPASLGALPPEYISRGYAKILQEKGAWKVKLAYFIVNWDKRGLAYAANFVKNVLAKGDLKLITCPADPTPPSENGNSYGVNCALANMSHSAFENLPEGTYLVGDCESPTFCSSSELRMRHARPRIWQRGDIYAQIAVKRRKTIEEIVESGATYQIKTSPLTGATGSQEEGVNPVLQGLEDIGTGLKTIFGINPPTTEAPTQGTETPATQEPPLTHVPQ